MIADTELLHRQFLPVVGIVLHSLLRLRALAAFPLYYYSASVTVILPIVFFLPLEPLFLASCTFFPPVVIFSASNTCFPYGDTWVEYILLISSDFSAPGVLTVKAEYKIGKLIKERGIFLREENNRKDFP